ncbi:MAG TPA: DUF1059 domain-containing protein [Dehalococcoidia bacterium]|nr:DUF1059 domain-containing protein [Dehalococcoidia bacterium]
MKQHRELSCRDAGVDCDFVARGETIREIVEQCVDHAVEMHGMRGFEREVYQKMLAHVRTVPEP